MPSRLMRLFSLLYVEGTVKSSYTPKTYTVVMTEVFEAMQLAVALLSDSNKVFWLIITRITIYVMNMLIGFKCSVVSCFPYKSVLINIASSVGDWMARCVNVPVTAVPKAATFPLGMPRPCFAPHIVAMQENLGTRLDVSGGASWVSGRYFLSTATHTASSRLYTMFRLNLVTSLFSSITRLLELMPLYVFRSRVLMPAFGGYRLSTATFTKVHECMLL